MGGARTVRAAVAAVAVIVATVPTSASAAPSPSPFRALDGGGFRNILPPGSNGLANPVQLAAFLATGARPAHNDDQLRMYEDLVHAVPGLRESDLDRFFKDASFGVKPEDVESTVSPRDDVTIQRDRFGVPHITASTRDGGLFGIGYATAQDRLFFIDVLRHTGRAQLSSFAGGSEGNRSMDRSVWADTPYTEADLERQIDPAYLLELARRHPELGVTADRVTELRTDLDAYVAGINAYITDARLDPTKMPGEYAAIGRPQGPDPWKATDVVSIASLVGGIFGKGGGGELGSALLRQDFHARFGTRRGERLWQGFRAADDPEAYTTTKRSFPGAPVPSKPLDLAIPDRGTVAFADVLAAPGAVTPALRAGRPATGAVAAGVAEAVRRAGADVRARRRAGRGGVLGDALQGGGAFPASASNALVVSGRESENGRPIAVFGPQTGYFAPQILMEHSVVAPGLQARGVAFPGTNLYVQLGRGRDYAWSATSAGNDLVDTFAVPLCEPGGGTATLRSQGYLLRGTCTPIETLQRTNAWQPSLGDSTPAGSETMTVQRTAYGPVIARATVKGRPVAYTRARTTYFHEIESAVGFSAFNDPGRIRGPQDYARAAYGIGFTFNWFYADAQRISYFNSGNLPVRGKRVHPDFPVLATARSEWRGFDPARNDARFVPFTAHPRSVDEPYYGNWNNKQAPGYRADDGRYNFSAVDRGELLGDRLASLTRGRGKASVLEVVEAMEGAGTVDLRGWYLLPGVLDVVGRPNDPKLAAAVAKLRAWRADGAHRRDRDDDGTYEHGEAIRIMDAWWPRWVRAQFAPRLGRSLADKVIGRIGLGDMPNDHLGSAFDDGIWGQVEKDLRAVRRKRVRGGLGAVYCGGGVLRRCRADLRDALAEALAVKATDLYRDSGCANGDQRCFDEVRHRPTGAVTQPGIHWINRPTFQQVVNVERTLPR